MEKVICQSNFFIDLLHGVLIILHAEDLLQIFLVNLLEPALSVVLPVLPTHDLYPGHHVLEQLPVDLLGQVDVLALALLVDVETVDEELDGAALEEHGEHDDGLKYSNDWIQETIEARTSVVVMNI